MTKTLLLYISLFSLLTVKAQTGNLDFTIDSTRKPLFCFHYRPVPEYNYRWGFYHTMDLRNEKEPFKTSRLYAAGRNSDTVVCQDYRDSIGMYWVCLEATYPGGLRDTVCKRIRTNYSLVAGDRNVFSPDSSGSKKFNIPIENVFLYYLVIYDRWGHKVFESEDEEYDWNGRVNNDGANCADGTYYYILKFRYKGKSEDEPTVNGTVRLIR